MNIHLFFPSFSALTDILQGSAHYKRNVIILFSREINNYLEKKRLNTDSYHPVREISQDSLKVEYLLLYYEECL